MSSYWEREDTLQQSFIIFPLLVFEQQQLFSSDFFLLHPNWVTRVTDTAKSSWRMTSVIFHLQFVVQITDCFWSVLIRAFNRSVRHDALGSVIVGQLINSLGDLAFPACFSQPSRCLSHCKCFGLTQNYAQKKKWLGPVEIVKIRAEGSYAVQLNLGSEFWLLF